MGSTTKYCHACSTEKLRSEFSKNCVTKDGLQTQCSVCKAAYTKQWYQRNKTKSNAANAKTRMKRYRRRHNEVWDYLLKHPCVDCGESNPVVLDFDHVRGEKIASVSVLIQQNRSDKVVWDEIAKCDVRCANCHRIRTAVQQGWYGWLERK
jgi:hypothetical protein